MSDALSQAGAAVHYTAVEPGTPVYDSSGEPVGEVRKVLDNHREHILDGIVISDSGGEPRFIDAPEVRRTHERGVFLSISAAEVAEHGPPEYGYGPMASIRSRIAGLLRGR